jgi:hypothetical protein
MADEWLLELGGGEQRRKSPMAGAYPLRPPKPQALAAAAGAGPGGGGGGGGGGGAGPAPASAAAAAAFAAAAAAFAAAAAAASAVGGMSRVRPARSVHTLCRTDKGDARCYTAVTHYAIYAAWRVCVCGRLERRQVQRARL